MVGVAWVVAGTTSSELRWPSEASDLDDDDADVVATTCLVGRRDERVGRRLRVGRGRDDPGDVLVGHLVDEAVGADEVAVARLRRDEPRVDGDRRLDADDPRDDVAMGVAAGLVRGDLPRGEHLLDVAVVAGELAQLAVGAEVDATVADVGHDQVVLAVGAGRRRHQGERGAHAPGGRLGQRAAVDGLVGGAHHVGHGGDRRRLLAHARGDGLEGDRAGDLTGRVAAHPVGHGEDLGDREDAVLVAGPDPAGIGRRPPAQLGHQPTRSAGRVTTPPGRCCPPGPGRPAAARSARSGERR